jgi:hypothetical protein
MMTSLFCFILASYGLTQILCYGKIFDRIRPAHHFFHCPMCIGWHVGVFLCVISPLTELFMFELSFANLFICGCISSGTSYALSMAFGDNGININRNTGDN